MSDTGRQDFTDKAGSALKPDSQKGYGEVAKEKLDSVASTFQPEENKSTTQKAGDTLSGNSNENSGSLLDKAKDAVGLDSNKQV